MARKTTFLLLISFGFGAATHLLFYPLIESWNNRRIQNLGRSGIGVVANLIPFLIWYSESLDAIEDADHSRHVLLAAINYVVSFVFFGGGAILGYLFDDWRNPH